jgi:hypothetical protein
MQGMYNPVKGLLFVYLRLCAIDLHGCAVGSPCAFNLYMVSVH